MNRDMRLTIWLKKEYDKYFKYDKKTKKFTVAKDTPPEAVESFELWKKVNHENY